MEMRLFLEVPKRGTHCSHGQEPLAGGSKCHSILKTTVNGWQRIDLCPACWEGLANSTFASEATSSWVTTIPAAKAKEISDKGKALDSFPLLRQAIEKGTPNGDAEAFVIALYLVRKKLLRYADEVVKEGATYTLYESPDSGEMLGIKKVPLTYFNHPEVRQELQKQLAELCPSKKP